MIKERLKWVGKAIEYELLTNKELNFLFETVQLFTDNYFINKTTENDLEKLFAEIQWREKGNKLVIQGEEDEKMEDRSRTSKWNESNRCGEV